MMKLGMVGLDTSHCEAFTKILHDPAADGHVPGARVTGAYPGGSAQMAVSRDRVRGFTDTLHDVYGIPLYDSLPALAAEVDAILLESSDARQHLEQLGQLAVGKPIFVDKPLACSTDDARAMLRLAAQTGTPLMSCSSLRYAAGLAELAGAGERVLACEAFGPAPLLDDFPGLFWYGIHSAEMLFARMGTGCRQAQCIARLDMDVVIGEWADGRLGVLRGMRVGKGEFGCVVHTDRATRCGVAGSTPSPYALMLREVIAFFRSGVSPIDPEETYEIIAFLQAAEQSRTQGGAVVELQAL
jgi:hypothetical protein